MHHDTFADLLEEVQDAREGWRDAMDERLEHIVGKYEALLRGDEPMA
jgi:hypothetical protein